VILVSEPHSPCRNENEGRNFVGKSSLDSAFPMAPENRHFRTGLHKAAPLCRSRSRQIGRATLYKKIAMLGLNADTVDRS
jgi:hypothetical protein